MATNGRGETLGAKQSDRIESVRIENEMHNTTGLVHGMVDNRGVMIVEIVAIVTRLMEETHRHEMTQGRQYPLLTNTHEGRAARELTNDTGSTNCTPTCVWPSGAVVCPTRLNCARGNSIPRIIPRRPKLYCILAVHACRLAPTRVDHR